MTTHGPIYQMVEEEIKNSRTEKELERYEDKRYYYEGRMEACSDILPKIQELEPVWISVEDRFPEESSEYVLNIVYQVNGKSFSDSAFYIRGTWFSDIGPDPFIFKNVTHWMPLPKPPIK